MRIPAFFLLLSTLLSCSTEIEETFTASKEIKKYIQTRYETADVNTKIKTEISNGKKETSLEISLGKSPVIDRSKADPELFASDIAYRLYQGIPESERKKYGLFTIKIPKKNQVTEFRYKNKSLRKAAENIQWLEGYFMLVDDKAYMNAKLQFDPGVDTATINLETLYESLYGQLGELKNRELQGFTIGETQFQGKTVPAMRVTYISFFEKHYSLSHCILLMDKKEQKLIAIDVE